ncbi:transcriptional antiterminator, BglG [Pseudarthrobacter chlorophenolicus A6]|uniref:Transcriptional antiterminator, BglG n=1 Tax=Pseudarthrobacter chlorophenolicus (strain ATCC 700700 / DSM 12829 / CIP 107037 / JCM 12360 / KCTC 9906 / NCIMB 13794 / A6) TaxID=452863 RepID=B8HE08_PSECP|nr:PRD domain-containing protein [Pseudarthrobacter chlorophenolicus]ACL39043.1 transcriptional antiterminator, BglG [Pseudarthrobacter chlorophenolicus A6]SDR05194.1 transcriptional antiterminator, BglG family [Pseudarthrobacter chlorophenolicus]
MHTIKKVLNSSVVLVEDGRGVERVLLGKGIGYGQKAGQQIAASEGERVFVALDDADKRNLVELLAQIPAEFIDLTRSIVHDAEQAGLALDPHIYLALTDHLHFAVDRQRRGLKIVNKLAWEMRTIYPKQYEIGVKALAAMQDRLGVSLPDDEAANIAFHLANADEGRAGVDSLQVVQLIREITTIVSHTAAIQLNREDLHSARFVAHLQYLVERFFTSKLLHSNDDFLFHSLSQRYPRAVASAERVRAFVHGKHGVMLPNEEVAFLALHIARAAPE